MKKKDVIAYFSKGGDDSIGIKRLSDLLNITREAIYQWPDTVPLMRQYQIERLTRKRLRVRDESA